MSIKTTYPSRKILMNPLSAFLWKIAPWAAVAFSLSTASAQITYVDASASNVTRNDGNLFSPSTTPNVYTDGNWSLRTGVASGSIGVPNSGTAYEGGGGESLPTLKQTLTGVTPGTYDVYVFFWVANNVNWQITSGLTLSSTITFNSVGTAITPSAAGTSPGLASSSTYASGAAPTVYTEADRTLIRARIGTATVDSSGKLVAYITGSSIVNANTTNSRTWFDGIGYGPVETLPGNATELAPDGAYTWFNDERAILHQGSLYAGYVKANGQYGVTRRNLTTGENSHMIISTTTSQQQDDHNNPSITELPDGKLMVLYSKHISGNQFYKRISKVALPTTSADWGDEVIISTPAANTYSNAYSLSSENKIYNFSRCINFNPTLTLFSADGTTWGTPTQLLGTGSGSTRPYPRYCSNGVDRIDLIYTDGHPRDVDNSVYHLYYKNGGLYKTDGTLIDTLANIPLDHDAGKRGNVVYQYNASAWGASNGPNDWIPAGRGWTWDVQYGKEGKPVCVFQVQVGTDSTWSTSRIYYYYARWTGSSWQKRFIAQAGRGIYAAESDYGGGMCLDPEDPRIVYISTNAASPFSLADINNVPLNTNSRFEIWRGITLDGGLTFTWTAVTQNSTADNLRPIVPVRHAQTECLMWFNGTYNTYTSFTTRLLTRIGASKTDLNAWAGTYGLSISTTQDSDQDGNPDLVEFAMGTSPVSPQSRPSQSWQNGSFSFPRPSNIQGVDWTVQQSSNLIDWQDIATLRSGQLGDDISSGFSYRYQNGNAVITPDGTTNWPSRFMRVKVEATNQ
jgi:BNR repeat-containing family member